MYGPSGKAKTVSRSLDTAGVQIPNFIPCYRKHKKSSISTTPNYHKIDLLSKRSYSTCLRMLDSFIFSLYFYTRRAKNHESKEHSLYIKENQNLSSQSLLHNPSTLKSPLAHNVLRVHCLELNLN